MFYGIGTRGLTGGWSRGDMDGSLGGSGGKSSRTGRSLAAGTTV